jgi:hypothetical protein
VRACSTHLNSTYVGFLVSVSEHSYTRDQTFRLYDSAAWVSTQKQGVRVTLCPRSITTVALVLSFML